MSNRHVIVVGAGAGGLAAAFDLAARGVKVTVLEQHQRPGGKIRQVDVAGRAIDAGPTVFTMRWVFDDLFAEAGLAFEDHVTMHQADVLARHAWLDGARLDLFSDVDRSAQAIAEVFGAADGRAYRQFAADASAIFETLDVSFMRDQRPSPIELARRVGVRGLPALLATKPFVSLWKSLQARFSDPRLVQLFARYSTYCGSSPMLAPATLQLIAHAERAGVFYLDGGMQALATTIEGIAVANGAQFHYGQSVAEILCYEGKATGVKLADGEAMQADAVIFNGDCAALANGLLGASAQSAVPALPEDRHSLSAMTWNLVATTAGFPLAHHTVLFGDNYVDEFDAVFRRNGFTATPTVYICAQDRTDDSLPAGTSSERLLCLINAAAADLDEATLQQGEERMLEMLAQHGLAIEYGPGDCVRTSPAQFGSLFPASDGALYGRPTHGAFGSFSRPGARSKLQGLYLTGGSVHPGAGVPMTTMSGRLAAACLRHDLAIG
ncbi:MAG: 1-hydroxycarotenoid 3,4-desaturase CrtD [Pseudomonadota bacterium]